MSLSDAIIQGRNSEITAFIQAGHNLNYIDEYGFTPLIQAAIVKNYEVAALLLKHGAQVDILDISGLTALHWAIDNDHLSLCELFLAHHADPNSYTAHAQPALFLPILRNHQQLKALLLRYGADIDFAQDYINAKLIGHRFELQGYSDIVTPNGSFISIDLEGFYLEFTIGIIRDALEKFINSYVANRYQLPLMEIQQIIRTLHNAALLREYKHFSKAKNIDSYITNIQQLINMDLLMLPISYKGHAITLVKHGRFLAKCDRGVHKMTDPIAIHTINRPQNLTLEFYKKLLYQRQTKQFMQGGLYSQLALMPFVKLPIRHQITGNCSWANVEACIPTMLFMLRFDSLKDKNQFPKLIQQTMQFYQLWLEWDKDRALEDCIKDFEQANHNRKKAKAALLGVILFQACDQHKPKDLKRAQKILNILKQKEYHYIIRSYINVFLKGRSGHYAKNFYAVLKACNFNLNDFA
jgi:hypothetical protein